MAMKPAAANEPDTAFAAPVTGVIGELVGGTTTLHDKSQLCFTYSKTKNLPSSASSTAHIGRCRRGHRDGAVERSWDASGISNGSIADAARRD